MTDVSPRYYGHLMVRADEWHTGWVIPQEQLDRHLQGRDVAVAADALRKAAEALSQVEIVGALTRIEELQPYLNPTARALVPLVQSSIRDWLCENADDIERGVQS